MSLPEMHLLHVLHVISVIGLVACSFYAFAAAPETRKTVMIATGVAALIILLTGMRMWQVLYGFAFLGWVVVKIVCWIALSALAGVGYRRRKQPAVLMTVILLLVAVALVMVYWQPAF